MSVWTILNEQNVWWKDKSLINKVELVRRWHASKVKWFSKKLKFKNIRGLIYFVKGPRQIGKSTHIFLKIRELLKNIEPFNILYIHCEAFSSRKELEAALREYLRSIDGDIWIFIDEATHIKDWYITIKYFKDIGLLDKAIVVITGSSSLDISKASSFLSGRRGETVEKELDKALLPMTFREAIITALGPESLRKFIAKNITKKTCHDVFSGKIPKELRKLLVFWDDIQRAFETYLITGGYPITMNMYLKHGKIDRGIYSFFVTLVRRDLQVYGYDPFKVDQILGRVIENLAEPVDYETIKSGTDIKSSTRLSEYLTALQNSFIITSIPYMDPSKRKIIPRKRRKYYFRDPFIHHAFKAWVLGLDPFEATLNTIKDPKTSGILIENIICEHIIRQAVIENMRTLADPLSHTPFIGYWKTKKGEVDFIIKIGDTYIPMEIKYREKIRKSDLKGLITVTQILKKKGIVVTKKPEDMQEDQYYMKIPAQIFLTLFQADTL